ncbi:hypothetical protein L2Y96_09370 [Luteibacter aegosomaticola]|uniref:hypothetical protein n=1 Tax=Luteibacter aegosomaticola TaxID=2911538 RepID=UPI001FF9319D|nr:hypothetical protein [Luteibacter aegosomaticola]UPG91956.1 hypothetical protein L2Y96_09370 [Luteibacter aegosomaticola]
MNAGRQRGSILIFVLAMLALLALVGAQASRFADARQREANDAWCRELVRAIHDDSRGGFVRMGHASIGDGAARASFSEGFHGSQTFPPGRDDCVRRSANRAWRSQGGADTGS